MPRQREFGEHEAWSHHVFRDDLAEPVFLAQRWSRGRPLRRNQLFPDKLDDFHGSQLVAVTFEHAPSIVEVPGGDGYHYDGE